MAIIKNKSKKAFLFSLVAIFLVSILLIGITLKSERDFQNKKLSIDRVRVNMLDNFLNSLENVYFSQILYVSTYRAFNALLLHTEQSNEFIDVSAISLDHQLQNMAISGQYLDAEGNLHSVDELVGETIMAGNTFNDIINRILGLNQNLNIELDIFPGSLHARQINPWTINVSLSVKYSIKDNVKNIKWNRRKIISTEINIIDFQDPLYLVFGEDRLKNRIKKANVDRWNVDTLRQHIVDFTYKAEPEAPSFLMRLVGNLGPSECCGIESLINTKEIIAERLPLYRERSKVDYLYWPDKDGNVIDSGPLYGIYGITRSSEDTELSEDEINNQYFSEFNLDVYHVRQYNVEGLVITN